MSYDRMKPEEERLKAEISAITKKADDVDAEEDFKFGPNFRGDQLPKELRCREDRLKKIREAKDRLEKAQLAKDEASGHGEHFKKTGQNKPKREKGEPPGSQQSNFTDPESRIMGTPRKGYIQGYNGQIAVDETEQIIVAAGITQSSSDSGQLIPMLREAKKNTKTLPKRVLADAGYKSEENFKQLEKLKVDAHVALGKGEGTPKKVSSKPATKKMEQKRKSKRSQNQYRKRKHIVEPAFGWIKSVVGFRSFSMRGLAKAEGEWALVCMATNLRRMKEMMTWA